MKKMNVILVGLFIVATSLTGCRETTEEKTIVREVEVESTDDKGILERTGEKVDKKVNEEIDEEIEKIGDDN